MTTIKYGAKYDKTLTTAAIAKLVRADLKAAVAAGELPAGKYSVTSSRGGGHSIDVRMSALAVRVVHNGYRLRHDRDTPYSVLSHEEAWLYSIEVRTAIEQVERIVAAYNFDGSDIQTDYFHVNFYSHVSIDTEFGIATRDAETASCDLECAHLDEIRSARLRAEHAEYEASVAAERAASETSKGDVDAPVVVREAAPRMGHVIDFASAVAARAVRS